MYLSDESDDESCTKYRDNIGDTNTSTTIEQVFHPSTTLQSTTADGTVNFHPRSLVTTTSTSPGALPSGDATVVFVGGSDVIRFDAGTTGCGTTGCGMVTMASSSTTRTVQSPSPAEVNVPRIWITMTEH